MNASTDMATLTSAQLASCFCIRGFLGDPLGELRIAIRVSLRAKEKQSYVARFKKIPTTEEIRHPDTGATATGRLASCAPESIEKFRQIFLQEFGVDLSFEEAAIQAQQFLSIARVVMQPMPKRFLPSYEKILAQRKRLC